VENQNGGGGEFSLALAGVRHSRSAWGRLWLGELQGIEVMGLASGGAISRCLPSTTSAIPTDQMDDDFEVERVATAAQSVFNSAHAKLLYRADVFWARASIGEETLRVWLETYQISRTFRKRGIVELDLP
jgi:hypothetical protein